jgi:hypothetical protein
MSYDLSDYVDVAERIRIFKEKFPEGSLQSELTLTNGSSPGWLCKAYAYRDGKDERPGIGHAFEPIPGKTPYTRDSEAMNAETSAWGRAIVALGFETKKIASAQEVQARAGDEQDQLVADSQAANKPSELPIHFGKNKGIRLGSLSLNQLTWYAQEWKVQDDPSDYDHKLKAAAIALLSGNDKPFDDVPFE